MTFSAVINGIEIRKIRLIDTEDGRTSWVYPPVEVWKDPNGKSKYLPLCVFPKESLKTLLSLANKEYSRLRGGDNGK